MTLNRTEAIDPAKVIRAISYPHPVFTPAGVAAQSRHGEISGLERRTHYCGAYWGWGFHEDGVRSALTACEPFGVSAVNSALYEGTRPPPPPRGRAARRVPLRLFMAYLDLDELPELFDGRLLWSARRPALAWFRRRDHLGDPDVPLDESVRALVAERTGSAAAGTDPAAHPPALLRSLLQPGELLLLLRRRGTSERVDAVVAHVTNTPWGESHSYVLRVDRASDHGSVE